MDTNSNQSNNKNTAILLISHGSTKPYNEEVFKKICEKYKKATGFDAEVGYMKVANPTISQAINNLKERNNKLENIIAVPVFLAPGIHTKIDIPILLGLEPLEEDPRCPDGNYPEGHYLHGIEKVDFQGNITLINPIGPHKKLLKIINNRIETVLKESKTEGKTGILLISHGSRLKYNKEFISQLHNLFAQQTDYPSDFGFMELTEPSIPTSIKNLDNENKLDKLVVIPVFIAPGMHTTHDIPIILGLLEEHHHHHHDHEHDHDHTHDLTKTDFDGEILYSQPIGADDILIEILKEEVENELWSRNRNITIIPR